MLHTDLVEAIANAAHHAWCARMVNAGWTPGDRFDPARRTHPAVLAYASLPAYRRLQLTRYIDSLGVAQELVDSVEIVLGEPEWTAADVRVGLSVHLSGDIDPAVVGTVVDWRVKDAESGALSSIRVRWPGDELVNHLPAEHELVVAKHTSSPCGGG